MQRGVLGNTLWQQCVGQIEEGDQRQKEQLGELALQGFRRIKVCNSSGRGNGNKKKAQMQEILQCKNG